MKRRISGRSNPARAAGLWLRCFLGGTMWAVLCLAGLGSAWAQVDVPGPERLTHVQGLVVSPTGKPVADVAITLVRDGKTALETKTDGAGDFRFEHVPAGPYVFRVARTQSSPAAQEIVVTDEIVTHLARKKLYVVLGPGACQDACAAVVTSKKEFDRTIRRNNRHGQGF